MVEMTNQELYFLAQSQAMDNLLHVRFPVKTAMKLFRIQRAIKPVVDDYNRLMEEAKKDQERITEILGAKFELDVEPLTGSELGKTASIKAAWLVALGPLYAD